jgi:tRNA nucleotidyltransferase (CCA-adding enzyme)
MDVILCHTTADFDALGAAVGLARLLPGSKIVLTGGAHPTVKDFLALYRDEYPLIERRSVVTAAIRSVSIVDTQQRDRLGKASAWLDLPDLQSIVVYDHHLEHEADIPATQVQIEPVGATTTIIVEKLQQANISLTSTEATIMALGIHVDTGSLTFEMSTARDALALAWLMQQGASLAAINEYVDPVLSSQLQQLLQVALNNIQYLSVGGKTIGWVKLKTEKFVPGLSSMVSQIRVFCGEVNPKISKLDALVLAHEFWGGESENRVTIIGRSQIPGVNLQKLFRSLGGGGHAQAASASMRGVDVDAILNQLIASITAAIPQPPTAKDLMSAPIRTIRPDTTIAEAQRVLLRYGHSGLPIVGGAVATEESQSELLAGIISRRDLDIALHHGFSHAPVKGYMTTNVRTITPDTTLPEIETLMATYDIGRLPVLADGKLVGIVTRTDVLRELHQHRRAELAGMKIDLRETVGKEAQRQQPEPICAAVDLRRLENMLAPPLWELLMKAARAAEAWGWHLYLVGGAVRDLLLADPTVGSLSITDIDLVVDGFHQAADVGAGVKLATALQEFYPSAHLDVHGAFQTAALVWHKDPALGALGIDIATARTEFYPYPAANPEVEASSIRQDLYRRDFTINAMALRLTTGVTMPLLDFFGGLGDLAAKQIRVLHPNSFIEDPTRIFRGVRFAVRLGFEIETQTAAYIRYAIDSGVYERTSQLYRKTPALQTRLKTELKYLLQATYWQPAIELLDELGALMCIHPTLKLDAELLYQLSLLARCLRRFDSPKKRLRQRQQKFAHWQLILETTIASLAPKYRQQVARNLQLPAESIDRLQQLEQVETNVVSSLPNFHRISQAVILLKQYDLPMLILIAIRCRNTRTIRRQIWQFLTVWTHIQPILTGNDLQKLGYKPGPQYRRILESLLAGTLDGKITDRSSAEAFLCSVDS